MARLWSRELVLQSISRFHEEHGRVPCHSDLATAGRALPSGPTLRRYVGGSTTAVALQIAAAELGLDSTDDRWTKTEVLQNTRRFLLEHGTVPHSDLADAGRCSYLPDTRTARRVTRLGSWPEIARESTKADRAAFAKAHPAYTQEHKKRDLVIVQMHLKHKMSCSVLSMVTGLSRERCRQILRDAGVSEKKSRRIRYESRSCPICETRFRVPTSHARRTCGEATCAEALRSEANRSETPPEWHRDHQGRLTVWDRESGRQIRVARLVVQQALGRPLAYNEQVHHKDGDPDNVALENLELRICKIHVGDRPRTRKNWSRTTVLSAIRRFHKRHGRFPTYLECAHQKTLPNPDTLRRYMDATSWTAARKLATEALGFGA